MPTVNIFHSQNMFSEIIFDGDNAMNFSIENNVLTVFLEGRIDSSNADDIGAELVETESSNPHDSVILDVGALEYISSAGLRVVLRIRKTNPDLKIINASPDVYDVFDMTGFTEMITVEKAMRRLSVDGCEVIGKGAKGTVYRYNEDTIIKVYKSRDILPDIQNECRLAKRAFVLGIPTAIPYDIVMVGDKYGSVFELLDSKSYSKLIVEDAENRDKYISEYASLLKKIHSTEVAPDDMPDIKIFVNDWLNTAEPYLPAESTEKLRKLIKETPDTLNMLHCDYHTNNVLLQNGETLLIDMDTLSHGHPIFELANIYITYIGFGEKDPTVVERFLGMPYDTAKYIWKKFIAEYLETDDAAVIEKVESKARLISCLRLLRHHVRHLSREEALKNEMTIYCKEKINALLESVDSLDF